MIGKRIFDIIFSGFLLLLLSPLFCLIAIVVKCTSAGGIFYSHGRVGYQGKSFFCMKFRTMYRDAERRLQPLLATDPALMQEWKTYFKLKADPRITPIGRFLRKTSLDELPQIWNVFRGDMSIVGPRPVTEYEVVHYLKERADTILSVRPGLTTLWITQGRNQLSLEQRVALEEYYVTNRSFWLDCKLIFKTILLIIIPKGAY